MKRTATFILAILMCIAFSVVSFADDIYIVEDDEPVFVPETTTVAPETTTAEQSTSQSGGSIIGDMGSLEDYFNDFKDVVGGGVGSLFEDLAGLGDLGDFNLGLDNETTTIQAPPVIDDSDRPTYSNQAGQMTQNIPPATTEKPAGNDSATAAKESTTQKSEVHSVLIVNGEKDDDSELSGSTLTLIVFIAAIILLILVAAIVLVVMTKRTEHNSSVMDKSTIPGVEKPRGMQGMMNDIIGDDGKDYGNITYWND